METITGEKLPTFQHSPVVSFSSSVGTIPTIKKITKEYIQIDGTTVSYGDEYKIDLWIVDYN